MIATLLAVPLLTACGSTEGAMSTAPSTDVAGAIASPTSTEPGSQAPPATSTATGSSVDALPQAVTANGITITLGLVDAASATTQFHFSIKLPADVAASQTTTAIGPPSEEDVQVTGLSDNPGHPSMSEQSTTTGEPAVPFFVSYNSAFPADQTVTLTISRIALPSKVVTGPWVFHVTRQMVETEPVPTPGKQGQFRALSIAEAQKLVAFPIIEPNPLPGYFLQQDINVLCSAIGNTGTAQANYCALMYMENPPVGYGVNLVETSNEDALPSVTNGSYSLPGPDATPMTGTIDKGSLATLTIDGVSVTTFQVTNFGRHLTYYVWKHAGVGYFLSHMVDTADHTAATMIPKPQTSDADLRQMVTSIIDQSRGASTPQAQTSATPPPIPTPDENGTIVLTFAQAQQISPFYVAQPQWVPSYLKLDGVTADVGAHGTAPTPDQIHFFQLFYVPTDGSHQFALQLLEHGGTFDVSFPAGSASTTLTISGHAIHRTVTNTDSGPINFIWQDQGTTFQIDAELAGPLTEQDVEHMIASMLGQG